MVEVTPHMKTFLSENVHYLLIGARNKSQIRHDCLRGLFFDWEKIKSVLNLSEDDSVLTMPNNWFIEITETLWGIIDAAGMSLFGSKLNEREELWSHTCWIGDYEWIPSAYEDLILCNEAVPLEITLKLTSYLERALGNVYLLKGSQVPFLLRDLLDTNELVEILGKTQVRYVVFMQLLFGCVSGLNIRNISWHGFLVPDEIHMNLVGTLLMLTSSIGKILSQKSINPRPLVPEIALVRHSNMLMTLPEDISCYWLEFENAVNTCSHIAPNQHVYWFRAYQLHVEQRYGDCLILILPQFEHMLRSVYCSANNCHTRILTAESATFYTTLDDILAPSTSTSVNRIEEVIGTKILEILMDTFSYTEGPRLRDRLSHGEFPIGKINEKITNHIFFLSLCIIYVTKYQKLPIGNVLRCHVCENRDSVDCVFSIIRNLSSDYEPMFHPISLLKRNMLKALDKLSVWENLARPEGFGYTTIKSSKFLNTEGEPPKEGLFALIQKRISDLRLPTLYRPRRELETVSLLSNIVKNVNKIHKMVENNTTTRFLLWQEKKLRSRGRINYSKMWKYLPKLQNSLLTILFIIYNQLSEISKINDENSKEHHRYLKTCLQHVENILSYSSLEKNKWDELCVLISEFEENKIFPQKKITTTI